MFAMGSSAGKTERGGDFMQTPARIPDTMSKLPDTVHMESAQDDMQQLQIQDNS